MSTINPLFLDSTKPIGDKVVTNVELNNIILHDGDTLYFEMTDQFGFKQRFNMRTVETKKSVKFRTEVWLKYQYQIRYRFIIESAGQEILASDFKETLAGHIISDKWMPCLKKPPLIKKNETPKERETEFIKGNKQLREVKSNLTSKPLVKPQFFDQIRSVFDDLL